MVDRFNRRWAGESGLEMEQPGAPADGHCDGTCDVYWEGGKAAGGCVWNMSTICMDAASCLFVHLTSFWWKLRLGPSDGPRDQGIAWPSRESGEVSLWHFPSFAM